MNPEMPLQKYCPANERDLFAGNFSSLLRELVMGSSRKDVLSAIRAAPLDAWSISEDCKEIKLLAGPTELTIFSNSKAPTWISADTPHGQFSMPAQEAVCAGILRRVDRRLEGYALRMRKDAQDGFSQLCGTVSRNHPLQWHDPKREGVALPSFAVLKHSYVCQLHGGLSAQVALDLIAGEVSEQAAFDSYCGYMGAIELATEAQRLYNSAQTWGTSIYGPFGSSSPPSIFPAYHIPPPLRAGRFEFSTISVEIYDAKLSRISAALGLSKRILYECRVDDDDDSLLREIWKQAQRSQKAQ